MKILQAVLGLFGAGIDSVERAAQRAEEARGVVEEATRAFNARRADLDVAERAYEELPSDENGRAVLRAREAHELARMRAETLTKKAEGAERAHAITAAASELDSARRAELLAITLEAEALAEHAQVVSAAAAELERYLAAELEAAVHIEGARVAGEAAREAVRAAAAKLRAVAPVSADELAEQDAEHDRAVRKALDAASFDALRDRAEHLQTLVTAAHRIVIEIGDVRLPAEVANQHAAAKRAGRPEQAGKAPLAIYLREDALFAARRSSTGFLALPPEVQARLIGEHRQKMLNTLKPFGRTGDRVLLSRDRVLSVLGSLPAADAEDILSLDVLAAKERRAEEPAARVVKVGVKEAVSRFTTPAGQIDRFGQYHAGPPPERPTTARDYG